MARRCVTHTADRRLLLPREMPRCAIHSAGGHRDAGSGTGAWDRARGPGVRLHEVLLLRGTALGVPCPAVVGRPTEGWRAGTAADGTGRPHRIRSDARVRPAYGRPGPSDTELTGAAAMACLTRVGVNGNSRSRAPVASKTAFAMAAATGQAAGSPAPHAGASRRSSRAMSIASGTAGKVRIG